MYNLSSMYSVILFSATSFSANLSLVLEGNCNDASFWEVESIMVV